MMRALLLLVELVALVALTAGCSSFTIETPPSMIDLKEHTGSYAYRAMTPDGVVLGIRVIDDAEKTSVSFWVEAVTLHMRELAGYAEDPKAPVTDITSSDGVPGKELHFGHDEDGKPYVYVVRLFVTPSHKLIVVEEGGTKEEMDKAKPTLDAALASLHLK
jgi:hypothetical protein